MVELPVCFLSVLLENGIHGSMKPVRLVPESWDYTLELQQSGELCSQQFENSGAKLTYCTLYGVPCALSGYDD